MPDDKTKQGQDRKRINVHERYELDYWMERLGVSEDDLIRAVEKVGPMVEDVEREIGGVGTIH